MPREEGVIEKITDQKALVRIQKSSSCASCESRGGCKVLSDRKILIEVFNDLQAKVGDLVEVSVPTSSLLKLSLLVYFLPILALILGAYAGAAWARSVNTEGTFASIVGGVLAMGLTFYVLRKINRAMDKRPDYLPRMTRILFSGGSPQPGDNI